MYLNIALGIRCRYMQKNTPLHTLSSRYKEFQMNTSKVSRDKQNEEMIENNEWTIKYGKDYTYKNSGNHVKFK